MPPVPVIGRSGRAERSGGAQRGLRTAGAQRPLAPGLAAPPLRAGGSGPGRGGAGGGPRSAATGGPGRRAGGGQGGRPAGSGPGPAARTAMVGRLSLQDVPELVDAKKKGDGVLDSPDSGLPPSPSPSHWALAAAGGGGGGGERAPAPGALEPDAAATPAAPVSDPASAPPPTLSIPPRPGPGDPQRSYRPYRGTLSPPPPARRPALGARGGSAARARPAGAGGWKIVIAWEAREPRERRPPPPPFGVTAPGAARLWFVHIPDPAGLEGSRDTESKLPPGTSGLCPSPRWLQRACFPSRSVLGRGVYSGSPIQTAKGASFGGLLVALEGTFSDPWSLLSRHLTRVWHMMGGRPLGGWKLSKMSPFTLF